MRKYIYIAVGGVLGSILRFFIRSININSSSWDFPLNTFIINITGTFILAFVITVALEVLEFDADLRLGMTTGFLGAYTTFSTLCKETAILIGKGSYYSAISYISFSVLIGLAAVYLGIAAARELITKLEKHKNNKNFESEVE